MAENSNLPAKTKRGPGRPFQPGQSGNPGGRPKVIESIRDAARNLGDKALGVLAGALESDDERARIVAANSLLDRGFGKSASAVEWDAAQRAKVSAMSDLELELFYMREIAKDEIGNEPTSAQFRAWMKKYAERDDSRAAMESVVSEAELLSDGL